MYVNHLGLDVTFLGLLIICIQLGVRIQRNKQGIHIKSEYSKQNVKSDASVAFD